jgi:hypothetical protein
MTSFWVELRLVHLDRAMAGIVGGPNSLQLSFEFIYN